MPGRLQSSRPRALEEHDELRRQASASSDSRQRTARRSAGTRLVGGRGGSAKPSAAAVRWAIRRCSVARASSARGRRGSGAPGPGRLRRPPSTILSSPPMVLAEAAEDMVSQVKIMSNIKLHRFLRVH
ncbi:hypothetical protein VTN00DRAFT_219 [Thermoascus crustaceus]|uniref:uncharacterized protein n=1 Tax=Thermoascus crustaceus TaxID=5088 RepID=UPI0037428D12